MIRTPAVSVTQHLEAYLNSTVISGACGLVAALVVTVGGVNAVQSMTAGEPVAKSSLGGYSDE